MSTPPRRRAGSRLLTGLALAATACLAAVPVATAEPALASEGQLSSDSLGSVADFPLSASASSGSSSSSGEPVYADYVALGDSYAAFGNELLTTGPADCMRSIANYPATLDRYPVVGDLTDVTCGGAVTASLFTAQHENVPAQLDALDADTDLVTLSIGGNDVGFSAIVGCITRQGPFAELPPTAACESQVGGLVTTGIEAVYAEGGVIDAVYDAIEQRSPDATVVATQYLPLMPAEGITCAFTDALNPADLQWAREVAVTINNAVADAAVRNDHISVLPTDTVDRSACAPASQRWTKFTEEDDPFYAAPFHPTPLGQRAMAAAVAAAL